MQEAPKSDWFAIRICQVRILTALAVFWQTASSLDWVDPELLPPLSKVIAALWDQMHDPSFLRDIGITLEEVLAAFAIVVPFGLISGFFIGERAALYRIANPTLQLLLATPKSIFLPIFILAFWHRVCFAPRRSRRLPA